MAAHPYGGRAVPAEVALVPVAHGQLPQHRGGGAAVVRVKVHEEGSTDGPPLVAQVGTVRGLDVYARGPGPVGDLARVFVGTSFSILSFGVMPTVTNLRPQHTVPLYRGSW